MALVTPNPGAGGPFSSLGLVIASTYASIQTHLSVLTNDALYFSSVAVGTHLIQFHTHLLNTGYVHGP